MVFFFFFCSEEVCILSASGTAAVLNPRFLQDGTVEGCLEPRLSRQHGLFSLRVEKGEFDFLLLRARIILLYEGGLQGCGVEIRTRHLTDYCLIHSNTLAKKKYWGLHCMRHIIISNISVNGTYDSQLKNFRYTFLCLLQCRNNFFWLFSSFLFLSLTSKIGKGHETISIKKIPNLHNRHYVVWKLCIKASIMYKNLVKYDFKICERESKSESIR